LGIERSPLHSQRRNLSIEAARGVTMASFKSRGVKRGERKAV
jgi:hypothetical protein